MNWLSQLPEGDARQNAIGGLVSGWANASPQDAANYVATLPAGKTQDSAALNVLSSWANADPAAAGAWAAQFPGKRFAAERHAEPDEQLGPKRSRRARASFWRAWPEGKSRDSAAQSYVSQLSWQSPELAAPYVNFIADDNQRYSSAMNLAHGYLRNDPTAAETWITGLNLPEDKKAQLRKMK